MGKPSPRILKWIITVITLLSASFLLFKGLGNNALWDDEANTALFAQSVWRTGDTYAMLDQNLIAHSAGKELKNLRNRYISPLSFYLAAPFAGTMPGSSWAARLPFTICGFFTVSLILLWLWKTEKPLSTWILVSLGLLGNVSFMLFARQCRYYALAIFLTTYLAYVYIHRKNSIFSAIRFSAVLLLLLATNYLNYAATVICLGFDYYFWGRKILPLNRLQKTIIFTSQIIVGGMLTALYNPIGIQMWDVKQTQPWLTEKLTLLFWNLRDINNCEFGAILLIGCAPLIYLRNGDYRLIRGFSAFLIYVSAVSFLSPQPVHLLSVAFIRYLAPVIPLCVYLTVLIIEAITVRKKWAVLPLGLLVFWTNIAYGGPMAGIDEQTHFSRIIAHGQIRSTVLAYAGELINPPRSTYRSVSQWINRNIQKGESIWITPGYAAYPLMVHAPHALYAWQLNENESDSQFTQLPDIHFKGRIAPEYIIAFGPYLYDARRKAKEMESRGIRYSEIDQIDQYWYDLTRPELFWHSFKEIRNFSRDNEAVYIFKKIAG